MNFRKVKGSRVFRSRRVKGCRPRVRGNSDGNSGRAKVVKTLNGGLRGAFGGSLSIVGDRRTRGIRDGTTITSRRIDVRNGVLTGLVKRVAGSLTVNGGVGSKRLEGHVGRPT